MILQQYHDRVAVHRGFVTVRFNFTGSGMKPGDELADELYEALRKTFLADYPRSRDDRRGSRPEY